MIGEAIQEPPILRERGDVLLVREVGLGEQHAGLRGAVVAREGDEEAIECLLGFLVVSDIERALGDLEQFGSGHALIRGGRGAGNREEGTRHGQK